MSADIAKLNKRVDQFCSSPSPLFSDEAQILLKELLKAFCYEKDFLRRNKLEQLLGMVRRASETDVSTYAHVLHSFAFEEYEAGNIDFAEYLFRSACDLVDDNSLNNNLATVLAYSDDNDFGIPVPVLFYKKLTDNYSLAIGNLLKMLERVSKNARKYYYEQIYEILYVMARNDDAASINRVFELCPDLEPEGYYSYDQMLPLGEAIENEAYDAISALVNNGCDIDYATMNTDSSLDFASSDKMVLFLIERGVTVEFSDIMDIWVWKENPELAKQVIQMTASSNIQQYIDCARYYSEDTSIYRYGGLEEKERQAFNNMIAYLAEIKNLLDRE